MTAKIDVKLVYCPICPALEPTRAALNRALEQFGREKIAYREVNVHDPANPPALKHWPSPAILINGRDLEGMVQDPARSCRLFEGGNDRPAISKLLSAFAGHGTAAPKIQLLTFPGCPNAEETRDLLARILAKLAPGVTVEEINVHDPAAPAHLRGYPSPSILVNGRDLEGLDPADAAACRIYNARGGVPDEAQVETFIRAALATGRR
jgi:metal-sulfur cluster biosynthetic enzyme